MLHNHPGVTLVLQQFTSALNRSDVVLPKLAQEVLSIASVMTDDAKDAVISGMLKSLATALEAERKRASSVTDAPVDDPWKVFYVAYREGHANMGLVTDAMVAEAYHQYRQRQSTTTGEPDGTVA